MLDDKTAGISPSYAKGGVDYYANIMKRHTALRNGIKGVFNFFIVISDPNPYGLLDSDLFFYHADPNQHDMNLHN